MDTERSELPQEEALFLSEDSLSIVIPDFFIDLDPEVTLHEGKPLHEGLLFLVLLLLSFS